MTAHEQEAKLEAAYSEYDYITTFDFVLPVSEDYEVYVCLDENVRFIDEYTRETSNDVQMKYIQGALNIHIECNSKQSFVLGVKDAEHTYKATCQGGENVEDHIVTEGIETYIIEDDEEEDEQPALP
jgi:hypothetical protein